MAMNRVPFRYDPDPVIEAYKKDLDVTLIQHSLRLSVAERLDRLVRLIELVEEMQRAGRSARRKAGSQRLTFQVRSRRLWIQAFTSS